MAIAHNSAYVQTETLNFTFAHCRSCWRQWFVSTWGFHI